MVYSIYSAYSVYRVYSCRCCCRSFSACGLHFFLRFRNFAVDISYIDAIDAIDTIDAIGPISTITTITTTLLLLLHTPPPYESRSFLLSGPLYDVIRLIHRDFAIAVLKDF